MNYAQSDSALSYNVALKLQAGTEKKDSYKMVRISENAAEKNYKKIDNVRCQGNR